MQPARLFRHEVLVAPGGEENFRHIPVDQFLQLLARLEIGDLLRGNRNLDAGLGIAAHPGARAPSAGTSRIPAARSSGPPSTSGRWPRRPCPRSPRPASWSRPSRPQPARSVRPSSSPVFLRAPTGQPAGGQPRYSFGASSAFGVSSAFLRVRFFLGSGLRRLGRRGFRGGRRLGLAAGASACGGASALAATASAGSAWAAGAAPHSRFRPERPTFISASSMRRMRTRMVRRPCSAPAASGPARAASRRRA